MLTNCSEPGGELGAALGRARRERDQALAGQVAAEGRAKRAEDSRHAEHDEANKLIGQLTAERDQLQVRVDELETVLAEIHEYWNRIENEKAMADACWHTVNVALEALDNPLGAYKKALALREAKERALGVDLAGRPFSGLLSAAAEALSGLGGGPLEDCLRGKATQLAELEGRA